jgi:hypothetical protein
MIIGISEIVVYYLSKSIEHFNYKQAYDFLQKTCSAKVLLW